jgi:hypothetical protein
MLNLKRLCHREQLPEAFYRVVKDQSLCSVLPVDVPKKALCRSLATSMPTIK